MKTHILKLNSEFADDVMSGRKPFEVRKNDRNYQSGDYIEFLVVDNTSHYIYHPIENEMFLITYVLSGFGIKNGYVVLGILARGREAYDRHRRFFLP